METTLSHHCPMTRTRGPLRSVTTAAAYSNFTRTNQQTQQEPGDRLDRG
jgi:hypothetical protein